MREVLTPERMVRLMRAKGNQLEQIVLDYGEHGEHPGMCAVDLAADSALLFQMLADYIEGNEQRLGSLETVVEVLVTDNVESPDAGQD